MYIPCIQYIFNDCTYINPSHNIWSSQSSWTSLLLFFIAIPFKMNQPDSERAKNEEVVPKDVVVRPQRRRSTGSSDSESDTELAELQKHVARRTAEFDPAASATAQTSNGQQVTLRQTLLIIVGCWLLLIFCPPLPLVLWHIYFGHNKYAVGIKYFVKAGVGNLFTNIVPNISYKITLCAKLFF